MFTKRVFLVLCVVTEVSGPVSLRTKIFKVSTHEVNVTVIRISTATASFRCND